MTEKPKNGSEVAKELRDVRRRQQEVAKSLMALTEEVHLLNRSTKSVDTEVSKIASVQEQINETLKTLGDEVKLMGRRS